MAYIGDLYSIAVCVQVDSHVPQVPKRDIEEVIQAIEASIRPALPEIPRSPPKTPTKSSTPKPATPVSNAQPEPAGEEESNQDKSSSIDATKSQPAEGFFMTQVLEIQHLI